MKVKGGIGMGGGISAKGGADVKVKVKGPKVKGPSCEVKVKGASFGCCGGKSKSAKADMKMGGGIGEIKGGGGIKANGGGGIKVKGGMA